MANGIQPDGRSAAPSSLPVNSPFAQIEASNGIHLEKSSRFGKWLIIGALALLVVGGGGFLISIYLNDPYRTLEPFPVGKYFEDFHTLEGSQFKAELRVEADLGWKEGKGRLLVFTTPQDSRLMVVIISPALASIYFTKGQIYLVKLEVKEGGLIHADSCRKE